MSLLFTLVLVACEDDASTTQDTRALPDLGDTDGDVNGSDTDDTSSDEEVIEQDTSTESDVAQQDTADVDQQDTADVQQDTTAADAPDDTAVECGLDEHICEGQCVSNTSPETCGEACTPCPAAPAGGIATCEEGSCGFECDPGFYLCDGACIAETSSCAVDLPDVTCSDNSMCGPAGVCENSVCLCATDYRACPGGCCPASVSVTTLFDVYGRDIRFEYGPDGTAYVMLQYETAGYPDFSNELRLYTRAPGATTIEQESLTLPVNGGLEQFDFVVRDDGRLFIAVAPPAGELRLYEWEPSMTEPLNEPIGAREVRPALGMGLDSDQTVWVTWRERDTGDIAAYSVGADGTRLSHAFDAWSVEGTDVERNPSTGGLYAFWHTFDGDSISSDATILNGGPALTFDCPAEDAAFDDAGRLWSIFRNNASSVTCLDGVETLMSTTDIPGALPSLYRGKLVVDGEGTAFIVFDNNRLHWLASHDASRWSRGIAPETNWGDVSPHFSVARAPNGKVSFAIVKRQHSETRGLLKILDMD